MDDRDEAQCAAAPRGDRVVVVTDSSSRHAQLLTRAFLAAARDERSFSIEVVIDTYAAGPLAFLRPYASWLLVRLFNPGYRKPGPSSPRGLRAICREFKVAYRQMGDVGVRDLDARANLLVSIYCRKKFSRAFLEKFDVAVNYHNGRLPAYRGALATNWELYRGETSFGFTFHAISEGIDEGNVLVAGSVVGGGNEYKHQMEQIKALAAAKRWPEVIERMKRRDRGTPQAGAAETFTRRRLFAIRDVGDPASITRAELDRRIKYFELVRLDLRGKKLPVTATTAATGGSPLAFVTADGVRLRAVRFAHLPYPVYRLGRAFARLRDMATASTTWRA